MAAKRNIRRNRRRNKGNGRYLILVLCILMIVAAGVYYLLGRPAGVPPGKVKAPASARNKIPPRPVEQSPSQQNYSSAVVEPTAAPPHKPARARHGSVAIIVDDIGNSLHEANLLMAIDAPITLSIIPGLAKGRAVAEAAHRKGRETMVHIPMEPKLYQQKPFEKNGLLLAMGSEEIRTRMEGFLAAVPHAVGANNHMGSRFSEDREKMQTVIEVLKQRGMFFVDSKTSPAALGDKLAHEMGVPAAARSVFLDNVEDVAAISAQLRSLAGIAQKRGSAIGICHPHKATIQALAETIPLLKKEGISFVPASALVW